MDRGAWWAIVHGCKELDTTEVTWYTHSTDDKMEDQS